MTYSEGVQLLDAFKDMLPAALGEPHIISTNGPPWTFVAFYSATRHEMNDGRIVEGNEFRLWTPSKGFRTSKALGGIIGICGATGFPTLMALRDQNTSAREIRPYLSMLREMVIESASGNIGKMQ